MNSQNGYSVIAAPVYDGPLPRLRRIALPGTARALILRDGSVGFVLAWTALWWHARVERLDLGVWDDWGWAYRPVRGSSSTMSNHSSGSAMDLNATRHPLGTAASATLTPAQIRRIRRRLRLLPGVRWGGDYHGRPDPMHLEVTAPLAQIEQLARVLMLTRRGHAILAANPGLRQVINS